LQEIAFSMHLAEILVTRLCHDLAGPVGTVAASLALADEDAASEQEARELAAEAATAAVSRLRLLRAAWGPAFPLPFEELQALAGGLPRHNTAVEMASLEPDRPVPGPLVRVLLNAILLGSESLPQGGAIAVTGTGHDEWLVEIAGPRAAWPEEFGPALADPERARAALEALDGPTSRASQALLTALLAHVSGVRISIMMLMGGGGGAPPRLMVRGGAIS
jgi:histidine phosphotransferase ChpT